MFSKKKAEYGIKEIISVILALSFLIFALFYIKDHINKSKNIVEKQIDQNDIEYKKNNVLLELKEKNFVVSNNKVNLKKEKEEIIFIGIKNNYEKKEYKIKIKPLKNKSEFSYKYNENKFILKENEIKLMPVIFKKNKKDKTELFEIYLFEENNKKDEIQITVIS